MRSPRVRFAHRLALAIGGIADVLAWMDSLPAGVLDRWIAFNAVEPVANPWLQTATVASETYRVAQYIAATGGGELDSRSVMSWIPGQADRLIDDDGLTQDDVMAWARGRA